MSSESVSKENGISGGIVTICRTTALIIILVAVVVGFVAAESQKTISYSSWEWNWLGSAYIWFGGISVGLILLAVAEILDQLCLSNSYLKRLLFKSEGGDEPAKEDDVQG